ncbi:MAG: FtsX-like permease family protein [Bauldia sp.]|nr:FtsX-like permease family protein [Bauldia sp.]
MAFLIRLALLGGRSSFGRPLGIVFGVALGMALFLLMLGAVIALDHRDDRGAWTEAVFGYTAIPADEVAPEGALLVHRGETHAAGAEITRLVVAAPPGATLALPGIAGIPAPGSYYASPALQRLIAALPPDEFGDRFGTFAGTIGNEALSSPDALLAVIGGSPETVRALPRAAYVAMVDIPSSSAGGAYQIVILIGAIGLFFPVGLLIAIVTKLGAVTRIERFATLRLIGASPRQIAFVVALEAFLTAACGAVLGVGLAAIFRPLAARIPLNGGSFFAADLAVGAGPTLLAIGAMVVAAAIASAIGIRRAGISPLGATRIIRERTPRWWRVLPLLTGGAMIWYGAAYGAELDGTLVIGFIVGGFALTALGIVVVGPWLTFHLSGLVARRAGSAAGLIAGSRIRATPGATFRSVSGLVIAVFMVTVFSTAAGGVIQSIRVNAVDGTLPLDALFTYVPSETDMAAVVRATMAVPGVDDVIVGRAVDARASGLRPGSVAWAAPDFATLGFSTAPDAQYATFSSDYLTLRTRSVETVAVPESAVGAPVAIVVRTDGTASTIDRARTVIERAVGFAAEPVTRVEAIESGVRQAMHELALVAYLGAFVSIAIAGCSLAVATASAVIDRRRVLGLLRMMGMPVSHLHRIVGFEAAVPLIGVLGLSIAAGYLVAEIIVENLAPEIAVGWPEPMYFVALALGLVLALVSVEATIGTIGRNTAVGSTRFE